MFPILYIRDRFINFEIKIESKTYEIDILKV